MQMQHQPVELRHDDAAAPDAAARQWARWGASGGLARGSLLRASMHYIATDPELSWEGTGMILGFPLLGAGRTG